MSKEKSLVIVESPAKARTISKFLGDDFTVEASVGHIRDLPNGAKEVPESVKSKDWAYLGVDVEHDFEPVYIIPPDKKKQVKKLKDLLKNAKELYLATDEDREGEAISWHLQEVLKPKVPVHRLVFHEITREAIQNALKSPRKIDEALVRAQETRRILDRLYGYDVSQLLWKKIGPKLSAGRVQSVAVRLIVDRERERRAFRSATYADLEAELATHAGSTFTATLVSYQGRRLPTGKDFDPATGQLKDPSLLQLDESAAKELADKLRGAPFRVVSVETKRFKERPKPPFTTSTLQQEANRKLGFTARRTMQIAQYLYENGYITYMRTDSTTLSNEAIHAARDLVRDVYGPDYLSPAPRQYASKVKNAQEAHEAIRPAGHPFELPQAVRGQLNDEQFKLFELIWKRTVACQMQDADKKRVTVTIEADGAVFQTSGTTIEFDGFLRAYVEGSDNPEEELAARETLLPPLEQGEDLECRSITPKVHTTQPPPRYTEASLTRTLEEKGIGRPSTYASIIDTIQRREYVFKKGNALVPSWTAFAVIGLLEEHFPELVDYDFTAQMEDYLDAISRAEKGHLEYLRDFYFGEGKGLKPLLESKAQEIDPRETCSIWIGKPSEGPHQEDVFVRVGRYGPFLEQGERRASIPDDMAPDELTLEKALELLDSAAQGDEPLGTCDETGFPIYLKTGRFGAYVQRVDPEGNEKPKNASLLKGMDVADVDIDVAQQLLSLPRELGPHPETGEPVVAANGRYGPYVKCGSETRSLPEGVTPLDVTLEQAVELLKQPKRRGRQAAKREPLKTFEASPVTGNPVQLLDGRYGPYVTDGETNASLPRDANPDELTFEQALELLAARAAAGPKRKRATKKAAAKKKATKKKAAKKKTTKKKAAKKKATQATKKAAKKKAGQAEGASDVSAQTAALPPQQSPDDA
ncbi:MAG: type I DNA topoisomerase [Planctomycetota bacterium]|nr:MAG: type I DNA topoisomerase [Planctomycetota bacterium]